MEHPYIKYAQALLMEGNKLDSVDEINMNHIKNEIGRELEYFYIQPMERYEGRKKIKYAFSSIKQNGDHVVFLSPHILPAGNDANRLYGEAKEIADSAKFALSGVTDVHKAVMPISSQYTSFPSGGKIDRSYPRASVYQKSLCVITSLTHLKPSLRFGKEHFCIIPELELDELVGFIKLFKKLFIANSRSDVMTGVVQKQQKKQGKVAYTPERPNIFKGNFPNPPRSSALCSIALLGTIGEMIKDSETSPLAKQVIKSLKNANIYMVKYGDASVFTYNHYIIRLASEGSLRQIVDSIYWCTLYNYGDREKDEPGETEKEKNEKETAYETFDLFAGRFLQLFNRPAFKDFLAFRATYPSALRLLLTTYFEDMEKIDGKVVNSAKEFGRWLNTVAYRAAKKALADEGKSGDEERRKVKAKFLVELESAALAAKTGDALIAQTITRAGRLSNSDAPFAASLFMEQAMSGELEVGKARNLLIAFLRLRQNKEESAEQFADNSSQASEQETDYSNI